MDARKGAKLKKTRVGREIVGGLSDLVEHLKAGKRVEEKFTVRTLALDLEPTPYTADDVRAFRDSLMMSQAVFATFFGVSTKLVQAWERGARKVDRMACRFLDEISRQIDKDPDFIKKRLAESSAETCHK